MTIDEFLPWFLQGRHPVRFKNAEDRADFLRRMDEIGIEILYLTRRYIKDPYFDHFHWTLLCYDATPGSHCVCGITEGNSLASYAIPYEHILWDEDGLCFPTDEESKTALEELLSWEE